MSESVNMTKRIAFVDDEEIVLGTLRRIFEKEPYEVSTFDTPSKAILAMEEQPFWVVVSDQMMPEMDGTDFLAQVRERWPDTVRILMTGYAETDTVIRAINQGSVFRFVSKPWETRELIQIVHDAMDQYRLVSEHRELTRLTEEQNRELLELNQGLEKRVRDRTRQLWENEEQLKKTLTQLRTSLEATIQALALTAEARDPYTAGHQRRVADLSRAIAQKMGLPQDQVDGVRMAGSIHDLGKIYVPSEILNKPGKIRANEFELVKSHSEVGYEILKTINFPWPVAEIELQHHERLNGSGYPNGLKGDEILLEARIIAVADVVESMSSHRPYRPALGIVKALEEIRAGRGTLFDERVVGACVAIFEEDGYELEKSRFS
ncbi:MAG TPA: HD domain-containing phosphohydrolase [Desulfobacteria bacterium]|nr:HD domain-containing phosphohydrolase [Desulfobacteria bacterium]